MPPFVPVILAQLTSPSPALTHTPQAPQVPDISSPYTMLAIVAGAGWALIKSMTAASDKRSDAMINIMLETQKQNHTVLLELLERLEDSQKD